MKKQNELSKPNEAGAKRKVKRSQLGGAKQVGAAGKKGSACREKTSALGAASYRPADRQAARSAQVRSAYGKK